MISWEELCENFREINIIIENNLFITLAVCEGAYLMKTINPDLRAPFWGFLGSFKELEANDLAIRYENFYDEFLSSFDIDEAFRKLEIAYPDLPSSYQVINSEHVLLMFLKNIIEQNSVTT